MSSDNQFGPEDAKDLRVLKLLASIGSLVLHKKRDCGETARVLQGIVSHPCYEEAPYKFLDGLRGSVVTVPHDYEPKKHLERLWTLQEEHAALFATVIFPQGLNYKSFLPPYTLTPGKTYGVVWDGIKEGVSMDSVSFLGINKARGGLPAGLPGLLLLMQNDFFRYTDFEGNFFIPVAEDHLPFIGRETRALPYISVFKKKIVIGVRPIPQYFSYPDVLVVLREISS